MLRKSFPIILLIALFSLLLMGSAFTATAQDQLLFTNTPAPSVGTDPTVAPNAIVAPMPPVLEQPTNTSLILDKLFSVLLLLAVVFLAFKQSNLIPPNVLDNVMVKLFDFAKEVTSTTATTADDEFIDITEEVVRRWIKDEQAKHSGTTPSVN
jgi:hypothetical protein